MVAGFLLSSCGVWVNSPYGYDSDHTAESFSFNTASLFPFEDNSNWWEYTEAGGNHVSIEVTDTISDDGVLYYRVRFAEERVDTTDDWFKSVGGRTLFGPALSGDFELFLPGRISSTSGSFSSAGSTVDYAYAASAQIGGVTYQRVMQLRYSAPILHGFDEIVFADGVGIVQLNDRNERWPIVYNLDSCSIGGSVARF
jgi:hypothetical protein